MARVKCKKDEMDDIDYQKIRIQVTEYQTNEDTKKGWYCIKETPEIYRAFTLPYIMEKRNDLRYAWLYRLANGEKQNEIHNQLLYDKQFNFRVYLDPGWVSKEKGHHCSTRISKSQWGKHPDTDIKYYSVTALLSARQYKDKLMTLRDVRGKHHQLLCQIKKRVLQRSKTIYGIKESDITMIIRYKPRSYLFHVHFVHVEHPTFSTQHFRDYSLNDVLKNIKQHPNYYRDKTFDVMVFFNHLEGGRSERFDQHIRPHLQGKYRMYMTGEGVWREHDDKETKEASYNLQTYTKVRYNTKYIEQANVEQKDWRQNIPKEPVNRTLIRPVSRSDGNRRNMSSSSRVDRNMNWRHGTKEVLSLSAKSKGYRRTAKVYNDGNSWRSSIRPTAKQIEK